MSTLLKRIVKNMIFVLNKFIITNIIIQIVMKTITIKILHTTTTTTTTTTTNNNKNNNNNNKQQQSKPLFSVIFHIFSRVYTNLETKTMILLFGNNLQTHTGFMSQQNNR